MTKPDDMPKTIEIPIGLATAIGQYLEATPTARDVPAGIPMGLLTQLKQHAETSVKRYRAQIAMAAKAGEKGESVMPNGHLRSVPMDELMAEGRKKHAQ